MGGWVGGWVVRSRRDAGGWMDGVRTASGFKGQEHQQTASTNMMSVSLSNNRRHICHMSLQSERLGINPSMRDGRQIRERCPGVVRKESNGVNTSASQGRP